MSAPVVSIKNNKTKMGQAQREARQQAEELVVTNATSPKPNDIVKANPILRKIFNRVRKYNDHFTEADSIALSTLAFNLHLKHVNETELLTLNVTSDDYERYLIRLEKVNKQINESMKQLCIPLNARLSLANDMAKVMIEEKKLQQMSNEPVTVNPLFAVLEATKNEK